MEMKIEISAEEVEQIIKDHIVRNVVWNYSQGKEVHVRGSSYSGLAAIVTVSPRVEPAEPEPLDDGGKGE